MEQAAELAAKTTRFGLGAKTSADDKLRAFEAMAAREWDRLYRYAYRLCGNGDDAEDLLAESLLEAFQAFDSYQGKGFDKWLFRILTTNRIDMTRRAKHRRAQSLDSGWTGEDGAVQARDIADDLSDPQRRVLDPLLSEPMEQALAALPEDFRAVLLLCDVEGMEYGEIAQTLSLPIGTVRSRIHRARTQMRGHLERLGWR